MTDGLDVTTLLGLAACMVCLVIIVTIVLLVCLLERRLQVAVDPFAEAFGDQERPPQ